MILYGLFIINSLITNKYHNYYLNWMENHNTFHKSVKTSLTAYGTFKLSPRGFHHCMGHMDIMGINMGIRLICTDSHCIFNIDGINLRLLSLKSDEPLSPNFYCLKQSP